MSSILERYASTRPIRPIYHEGGLYLKRYYVTTLFGYWRVYLHHFLLGDPEGLHNHPFNYSFSFILLGKYLEHRRQGSKVKKWFNWIGPDRMHQIDCIYGPCWTLFFHSPRNSNWAILRAAGTKGNDPTYHNVMPNNHPTPLSDWYKTAITGAEWEAMTTTEKETYMVLVYGHIIHKSRVVTD